MNLFSYHSPVIRFMVKAANLAIVSFFWLVCCLPLVTVLPACAALYHTTGMALEGRSGIARAFFAAFRDACMPGIPLSIAADVLAVLIYFGLITGLEAWKENTFWAVYLAAGLLIAFLLGSAVICLGPVLSRFAGGAEVMLRLAFYFSGRNVLWSALRLALLVLTVWLVSFFPLLVLILPGVYTDLIRGVLDRDMNEFIASSGLEDTHGTKQDGDGHTAG